ncbi:stAR-related lipid transfer protein 9-like [Scleropages formosus]|uniref:StAR-related lipid transfer protein 9-like n=1 Tax=Scleropages formosus TaxID=113540 RepID=A0A0P7V8P7_SCLFO|nr:stAR-related lipid transfer protein 9-like [Scleropages formosus]
MAMETMEGGQIVVQVEDKVVQIRNMKLDGRLNGHADSREKVTEFGFDYCYWSVDPESPKYASQEEVFQDLGVSVLAGASEGYNVCLFAYGQTGSGKTYTMMGTPDSTGLTPRICQFFGDLQRACARPAEVPRAEAQHITGLLQYIVSDYKQAVKLLEMGIGNRMTATTHMHDASSRSHAIFSIQYTQAILENNLPSEIVSKINLVDLAGSERADPNFCRDRITEGSNINKSLVTLGIVISGLAQNSQMFSSCQSINSMASEGEGSTVGSQSSSLSGSTRRQCFIPYRDSVLTWLLKDSLGGNSKTIMIATISPSCSSYNETLSTLRYAAHARNIVNKPRVNEDANVKLIRELREEIDRLKSMLLSFEMQRNSSPSLSDDRDGSFSDIVLQNELKVEQLTKDWSERWHDQKELLEQYSVDIDRDRAGFLIRSLLPHLIALDQDVLNTGVTFYHLRLLHFVVLQGEARCEIVNQSGVVILKPVSGTVCMVNGREVTEPYRLAQGAIITLGDVQKFRFNHPAEAAILRARRRASEGVLGCFSLDLSHLAPDTRVERDSSWEQGDDGQRAVPWKRVEEQQRYVQCLREEIQVEQQRAELDLEREQAHLRQQHREIQQWVLQEKQRLSADGKRVTEEPGVQSDLNLQSHPKGLEFSGPEVEVTDKVVGARKQVVQEELLRHHALRRAESRVRQKRLRYQLQRIARKRLLLEAKRELQRLETALSPEAPSSPEPVFPMKTRAPAHHALRRHSFSADLLSRLYPKHTPIFSHFLRRNKSLELSSSLWRGVGSQKWVSDEFLPSRKMRNRANTLPSGSELRCATRTNSLENLRAAIPHSASTSSGMRERTKSRLIESSQEQRPQTDSLEPPRNGPKKTLLAVSKSNTSHFPPKISKSFSQGSKGLERIRKVFAQSAGPGIRNALSKLFRKPPSRFVAARVTKSINNTAGQFSGNKESERNIQLEVKKTEKSKVKVAFSCENLEQVALSKRVGKRRWHSEEALTKVVLQTKGQPSFPGWLEKTKLEDKEGSSDCDSSYSLDSLSSAYATALTEQLRQADFEQSGDESKSEPESVDSQISKDSLVIEGSSKITVKPKKFKQTLSSLSYTHVKTDSGSTVEKKSVNLSSTGSSASDEMPAEAYWRLHSNPKPKHGGKAESRTEVVNQQVMGSEHRGPESKTSEELADGWSVAGCDPHLFTCAKEPESLHVLTHPWSSTNNTNNPRIQKPNQGKNKHQVFGSATDISSKNPAVDVSMNRVIRCCSVDNGLSIENSLFHSHLSTFANNKRLSNTLSSVEGYKEQGSSEAECPTSSDNQIRLGRCNSYCSDTYGDGDNDSSQMSDDEVMVVCSSEQESLDTGYRDHSNLTCNQSTQTTTLEGMQKMRRRRKRSSTRIQKTCVGPESSRVPSTWASLHNMSLHLSQLIHNTSDLLGNIQYMGAKDTDHSAEDKVMQMPSGRYSNRDSSTQTAVDVAIQTDVNSISVNGEDDNKAPLMEGKSRHHEVNVIVRVIGSDVLGVSQEKESITLNKKASEKIQSMPDLHIGSSVDKSYLIAEAVSSKFRTSSPSLDMISQNQTHLNTDVSSVFPADYTPEQVSSSLGTASINSRPKSQTSKKHNNLNCSSKEVCFTDRASSPILTVEAGLGAQIVKSKSTQCLEESVTRNSQEMYKPNSHNLGNYHRESNDGEECWNGSESFDISEGTIQLHEDDAMSVAPSECNTDILININPFVDSIQKEHCKVPEDLPMHNKFTNWSGVSCQSQSSESRSLEQFQSAMRVPAKQKTKKSHTGAAISESCKAEFKALSDDRLREIERLRQEREKVMAAVRLDLNPHQLTVELAEAKLHYGLGETDTLLKLLKSDSIEEPFVVSKKQELYERHRKSIEGLRQKREERLRTCRRARSLSPSKHSVSTGQSQKSPVTATELPSQQREYLQKLPQAVVTSTSTTPPSKQEGACPSEIELLLQDYGRAREEARMEIARARDRLRERAEQEKRRLQQQALSQFLKDDLRFRTRASNSTLCTGSSLSLSSGPTSGYNSSNTVLLKEANRLSQTLQVSDKTKDAVVISSVPPVPASQNVGSHRPWLSAQDVRVEHTDVRVELDPQLPPSSSPPGWKRTLSLSSAPSVSTYFQDIAASAVSSAISEIRSAADGDLQNLLVGRSSGGWRHQGTERGVQAFYKSSSSLGRYSFLGAAELERPLPSLWCMIRDHSKTHLYHHCVHTTWTRPLDSSTQLVYLLTDCSTCRLSQPRDFCCISAESKQVILALSAHNLFYCNSTLKNEGEWVLALRSVNEESLPPPNANAVRGELLPSAWLLQPGYQGGREIIRVVYLLQVDLGTPALPQRLLSSVARKQAAVIAELDAFFSL